MADLDEFDTYLQQARQGAPDAAAADAQAKAEADRVAQEMAGISFRNRERIGAIVRTISGVLVSRNTARDLIVLLYTEGMSKADLLRKGFPEEAHRRNDYPLSTGWLLQEYAQHHGMPAYTLYSGTFMTRDAKVGTYRNTYPVAMSVPGLTGRRIAGGLFETTGNEFTVTDDWGFVGPEAESIMQGLAALAVRYGIDIA
jgi:hypothetical protein